MKEKLIIKLNNEYEEYINSLLSLSKEDIIINSYQTTIKKELIYMMDNNDLSHDLTNKLLLIDDLLTVLYAKWLKIDCDINELLYEALYNNL